MDRPLADKISIRIKAAYLRITLTKVTAAFCLFSFLHCFVQGSIQAVLYSVDAQASSLVSNILREAQVPVQREFPWLTYHGHGHYNLQICNDTPYGYHDNPPCITVFQSGTGGITIPADLRRSIPFLPRFPLARRSNPQYTAAVSHNSSGAIDGVTLSSGLPSAVLMNTQCTRILLYPDQILKNMKREDITLIFVQFWLFSISFMAIQYDSVPHTLSVLCSRVLATGWSAYTIWRTADIKYKFQQLIVSAESPCNIDLFPAYFKARMTFEIADLALNITALVISGLLSINLVRTYRAQIFKRAGPPAAIIRIYHYFLAVLVCLHLSVFFLIAAMVLWVDQLMNSAISLISKHTALYQALFISTTILLVPWIVIGFYALRLELKRLMFAFLSIAFTFIACWSIMFYSQVYRWTFTQWPFLACLTLEFLIVMVATMVFGILSWLNFGRGLKHWLYVEEVLQLSDFQHEVFRHDIEDPPNREKSRVSFMNRLDQKPIPIESDLDRRRTPTTYYIPTLHTHSKGNSSIAKLHVHSHEHSRDGMTGSKGDDERKVRALVCLSTSFGL